MSKKKVVSRRELLERWRAIEDEEEDDHHSNNLPDNRQRLNLKEDWFSDAFNFLISLPKENHIWCHSWDLMGPLLETFYNYFKDERQDSPLKLLWKRISEELQQCMRCICQHHQAIEMYNMEYDSSSIGPLLDVLSTLDEERVTNHLKEINANITKGEFDQETDNAKIVSVMYEVLMFPILLDDQYLVSEFQIFIEAIDDSHELTLADHQQYPGVYALLFVKSRRTRSIGFRLAAHMGKLRRATDLEPLHPLLKKCIDLLETEELPSTTERSRPRMQLDRITVWLGIKALLGFLEPPTFEEGILERHPNFLNIVLNHICDDSPDFSYAVNCLRLLFEMLGCKLWLRSALSPSVMCDTLLGQYFHTQNEKSHKDIFDLFQPFVQSLEALQDGENEKQRRGFLYFLLHQVIVSSNFSTLTRKKACQILKEEVRDLLDSNCINKSETTNGHTGKVTTPGKPPIQIRETSSGVITLAGSSECSVKTLKEMAECLEQGSLNRATGSTNLNNQSSRSHAIFTITLEQMRKLNPIIPGDSSMNDCMGEEYLCAKLHLVNLAGSERAKRIGSDGMRFKEGAGES